jgi:2-polyprenyl-3-methyl-5-hydroxy-6-metoxy-1,4-benzoquinol methylase
MKTKIRLKSCASRIKILNEIIKGKSIAHFGAADHPFTRERLDDHSLLHYKLNKNCVNLKAFDISLEGLEILEKNGYESEYCDINSSVPDLDGIDLVVFGEIIEHLGSPQAALENIGKGMISGAQILVSTPNAFYGQNFINAFFNIENVHPDHLMSFTPITLKKIMEESGFELIGSYSTYLERRGKGKISKRIWRKITPIFPSLGECLVYIGRKK